MGTSSWRRQIRNNLLGVSAWKIHLECGASADFAVDPDGPSGLRDDAKDGGHAQPRTFARLFGRKKRLEQASLDLRCHADPRITHNKHDVGTRLHRGMCRSIVLVELDV